MACQNCHKIRTVILHGKMAEAAGLTVDALREKIGWKADEPVADAPVVEREPKGEPKVKRTA